MRTCTASGRRATGRPQRSAVRNAMSGWQRLSVLVAKMTVLGNQDAVLHPRRRLRRQKTVHQRRPGRRRLLLGGWLSWAHCGSGRTHHHRAAATAERTLTLTRRIGNSFVFTSGS